MFTSWFRNTTQYPEEIFPKILLFFLSYTAGSVARFERFYLDMHELSALKVAAKYVRIWCVT